MFRSRKTRRAQKSNRTQSPRLGVELMEGRMMLSGTGFDASLPSLDLTQYTVTPAQIRLGGAPVAMQAQPADGGFVNADDWTYTNWFGSYSTSVAVPVSLPYSVNDKVFTRG